MGLSIPACVLCVIACILPVVCFGADDTFALVLQREKPQGTAVRGTLTANGDEVGSTMENANLMILPGHYDCLLRNTSPKGFIQGPFGTYGQKGDFLLEVAGVKDSAGNERQGILFHGGNKAVQSEGCILLGAVSHNAARTEKWLTSDLPLVRLRQIYYGTDLPNASRFLKITLDVRDAEHFAGSYVNKNLTATVSGGDGAPYQLRIVAGTMDMTMPLTYDGSSKSYIGKWTPTTLPQFETIYSERRISGKTVTDTDLAAAVGRPSAYWKMTPGPESDILTLTYCMDNLAYDEKGRKVVPQGRSPWHRPFTVKRRADVDVPPYRVRKQTGDTGGVRN